MAGKKPALHALHDLMWCYLLQNFSISMEFLNCSASFAIKEGAEEA